MKFDTKYLEMDLILKLEMISNKGEFSPALVGASVRISGPKESENAADYLHENLNIMIPYILARYLMNMADEKNDTLVESAVHASCEMAIEYIESRSGGNK